ncbi:MAG: hypothetical protein M1814_004309 [Vezdaea aestivalis]|nr:MAG: hypothetical protein M1814_004309 [Vezdaea aestivalis]
MSTLSQIQSLPDVDNYFGYILATPNPMQNLQTTPIAYQHVRLTAAIQLKNDIRLFYKSKSKADLDYIRSSSIVALRDTHQPIRNAAGSLISEIVCQGSISAWPQLFSQLFGMIENSDGSSSPEIQDGAMSAISKVCEDNSKSLIADREQQHPLDYLIPRLLEATKSTRIKVRTEALASLIVFLPHVPTALYERLDTLLVRLSELAQDPSEDVRKYVCRGFVNIAEVGPEKIKPYIAVIVDYMLVQQQAIDSPDLALDAASFWLSATEHKDIRIIVAPYLPKIVPILLESMVYSAEDITLLECADGDDDADREDRAEDVKPVFAKSKGGRLTTSAIDKGKNATGQSNGTAAKAELSDGEIEEETDDEEDGGDPEDAWNLRKCSAAALDHFATQYPDIVIGVVLPYLIQNLKHSDWPNREAAVLALGAVADGCMDSVAPHLRELVPYLLSLLNDSEPVVRKITCWTLGRYSGWASKLSDPKQIGQLFEPMMDGLLQKMLDKNKSVQQAAVTAFIYLEEQAGTRLLSYSAPIARQLVRCFSKYKDRNMNILYDCIGTFAESLGVALAQDEVLQILMPAIMGRWNAVPDNSQELFPLMECLQYIAGALAQAFDPFSEVIFVRCIAMLHQNLEDSLAATRNPVLDEPDKDYLIVSLDLLSAIIQALPNASAVRLVTNSQPSFFQLLVFCLEDKNTQVRQSSYALLGDTAIYLVAQLRPYLPSILPILAKQLDLDRVSDEDPNMELSVINNACWSLGEISMRSEQDMKDRVLDVSGRLTSITSDRSITESVNQNAAIALGRLGILYHTQLAPHLSQMAEPFLESMENLEFTDERDQAFHGFNLVVVQNPQAMEKSLASFFRAIADYLKYVRAPNARQYAREVIIPQFGRIIEGYRGMMPNFDSFINNLDPPVRRVLQAELSRQA